MPGLRSYLLVALAVVVAAGGVVAAVTLSRSETAELSVGWVCRGGAEHRQRVAVGAVSLDVLARGCPATRGATSRKRGPPTIVLLHGYPDFAVSWRPVMAALADRYQVVAPDQRGYRGSDAPVGLGAYYARVLAADVRGLVDAIGAGPVLLVGHDWGGAVAWLAAHLYPERVAGLVVINGPHPDVFARELRDNPAQRDAAAYMNLFVNPAAEDLLAAGDYQLMLNAFGKRLPAALREHYREAYARPGRLTAMLNWYRANIRKGPKPAPGWPRNVTVKVPTLVLWGMGDKALLPGNLKGLGAYVSSLRIQKLPGVSHWVVHEAPDTVIKAIEGFADTHLVRSRRAD